VESKDGGEIMREAVLQGLEQAYGNLVHMIADFLPRFLVMLIIIVLGLLAAFVLKYILRVVLSLTKLDRVSEEAGASRILRIAHLPSMTALLSRSIFWLTWFGFILTGLSVLGVASLQGQISRLLQFLPEVFVGILILFLGLVTANFLSRTALLAAVNAGHPSPRILSWSIRFVIWILAITMTLEELGVAKQTVISAFSIIFGALMFGLAIAFGLGGQDLARKALEKYLGNTKKERDKEPQPL
jgi:small-conductance mechanosensitive channel